MMDYYNGDGGDCGEIKPRQQKLSIFNPNVSGTGSDKWGNLLDANSAGMAGSAEEFTKQFMNQLTGNTAGNLPPPL